MNKNNKIIIKIDFSFKFCDIYYKKKLISNNILPKLYLKSTSCMIDSLNNTRFNNYEIYHYYFFN